jgi:RNA polymerase sigma-70 factor (ECF subfamily)
MASLCWMFTMPAGTTTLQQLLDEAAFRDGSIYDKLLEHASERLRALSRKSLRGFPRLASLVQTDDVLQEALLRLHSSLNKVRPSSLRGFFGLAAIQIRRNLIDLTRHLLGPEGYGTHVRTGRPTHGGVYLRIVRCARTHARARTRTPHALTHPTQPRICTRARARART